MIHHAIHAPINSATTAATIINAYSGAASDILRIFSSRPRSCFGAVSPDQPSRSVTGARMRLSFSSSSPARFCRKECRGLAVAVTRTSANARPLLFR